MDARPGLVFGRAYSGAPLSGPPPCGACFEARLSLPDIGNDSRAGRSGGCFETGPLSDASRNLGLEIAGAGDARGAPT